MLSDFFATKLGMTQAWTTGGKRVAITRCKASDIKVTRVENLQVVDTATTIRSKMPMNIVEVGTGKKKFKSMPKPQQGILTKAGFTEGALHFQGIRVADDAPAVGSTISVTSVLSVGDIVKVQGTTKGRGFAGAVKRYGFHGGPKTHGQSDRERAVGSIGAGTTPGRVWKGKRMPGHYGVDIKTVSGLVVVHIDPTTQEVWLSGPVPGSINSQVKISKTGESTVLELDLASAGVTVVTPQAESEPATESTEEAVK